MTTAGPWRVRVDAGGTFTDGWARDPAGAIRRAKVLSSSALRATVVAADGRTCRVRGTWTHAPPAALGLRATWPGAGGDGSAIVVDAEPADPAASDGAAGGMLVLDAMAPPVGTTLELRSPEPAAVLCARVLTGTAAGTPLPPGELRVATTRATNALLERRGARTAVLVTRGLGDLPLVGDQRRPELFARVIRRPPPLFERVVEIDERVAPDGTVEVPLDEAAVAAAADALVAGGIEAAAVCLLHAVRHPEHERRVAMILRSRGVPHVSTSVDGAARGPLVPRLATTVVDAFVGPVLGAHLEAIAAAAGGGRGGAGPRLRVLASDGGVRSAGGFRPAEGLLSGPAGGVAGAAAAAVRAGVPRAIGLDMGGTSTDVCRIDGEPVVRGEHRVGDGTVLAPALAIETVAAGGGSICRWDGGRLRVGPESAGADPGPACHGGGGPLTITDCTLLLGRMMAERFPFPPDRAAAEAAADALLAAVRAHDPAATRDALLAGCCDLAAEAMADAIRAVTVREGHDPADHALVAFGGAGGQHACGIAERLGVGTVVFPADASILSAVGLDRARPTVTVRREVLAGLRDVAADGRLDRVLARAAEEARDRLLSEGARAAEVHVVARRAHVRQRGQESTLEVPLPDEAAGAVGPALAAAVAAGWADAWRRTFGHAPPGDAVPELESVEVRAAAGGPGGGGCPEAASAAATASAAPAPLAPPSGDTRRVRLGGRWLDVPAVERTDLAPGTILAGPAMVVDERTSVLLHAGWRAEATIDGDLVARRAAGDDRSAATDAPAAPAVVRRELTAHRLRGIAVEMGEQLRRTARSVNVRDRLDFSCGVLDADGRLLASAPHVPVHLGALGACVRAVVAGRRLAAGDVVVVNHPAFGGSHLPDVTVIAPVDDADGRRLGHVAARAHHAELGGRRPGSMAPSARTLAEEGVVIPPTLLVEDGRDRAERVAALLAAGPHPSRRPADNLADLRAQVAACRRGADALRRLASERSAAGLAEDAAAMLAVSREMVGRALAPHAGRTLAAADALDDGTPVRVRVVVPPDPATAPAVIDLAGSGGVHPGAFNAPRAVTAAAAAYVLRLLVDADVSLDDGLLDAVELRVPPGLLDPPFDRDPARCPAVSAGNVETSQRVVDVLLAAFGLLAAGQGTMNNVLFGDASFGFYETVGGGAGAGPDGPGAGGVHVHMTNTALTDPEILERRHPVRLERFGLRRGSGGDGRHRGGDGLERVYRFTAPVSLSLVTGRRAAGPPGLDGGGPGAPGEQWIDRAGGSAERLGAVAEADLAAGDRLVLRTPGGGGWGPPAGTTTTRAVPPGSHRE